MSETQGRLAEIEIELEKLTARLKVAIPAERMKVIDAIKDLTHEQLELEKVVAVETNDPDPDLPSDSFVRTALAVGDATDNVPGGNFDIPDEPLDLEGYDFDLGVKK